jgi:hypothetical protein
VSLWPNILVVPHRPPNNNLWPRATWISSSQHRHIIKTKRQGEIKLGKEEEKIAQPSPTLTFMAHSFRFETFVGSTRSYALISLCVILCGLGISLYLTRICKHYKVMKDKNLMKEMVPIRATRRSLRKLGILLFLFPELLPSVSTLTESRAAELCFKWGFQTNLENENWLDGCVNCLDIVTFKASNLYEGSFLSSSPASSRCKKVKALGLLAYLFTE